MKFVFFFFIAMNTWAASNTLPEITSAVVRRSDVNRFHRAFSFDIMPRNASGVVTDLAGSLGTSSYEWDDLKLKSDFNIREQLGPARSVVTTAAITSTAVTSSSYTTIMTTTGATTNRPLLFYGDVGSSGVSNPSYIQLIQTNGTVSCTGSIQVNMNSDNITEFLIGASAGGNVAPQTLIYPITAIFQLHNNNVSSGTKTFTVKAKVDNTSCNISVVNGSLSIYEI